MTLRAYLTVDQAAELAGRPPHVIYEMCRVRQLPCLRVGGRLRIEARALDANAPDPFPEGQEFTIEELALHWNVKTRAVLNLIVDGQLASTQRGTGRKHYVSRRAVLKFVVDHTTEVGDAA